MARELTKAELAERSINKKFRKAIWNKFIEGVKTYELIKENDKIAVCISGGKDSMMLAVLMKMLQRYSDIPFELKFIVMDPGYNTENRAKIVENAKILDIPIHIFETDIFEIADNV